MLSEAARHDPAMTGQVKYDRVENEFYPTPVKFVTCLAEFLNLHGHNWWEPCAGQGHIVRAVEEITGHYVERSDITHYPDETGCRNNAFSETVEIADFLLIEREDMPDDINGIITNPPYLTINLQDEQWAKYAHLAKRYSMGSGKVSLAELFLRHALYLMEPVKGTVAMFLRNEFDCGKKRMNLFRSHSAYALKVVCTERPRWIEGSTGSPRHNYSWFVFDWLNQFDPTVAYSHPDSAKPITIN